MTLSDLKEKMTLCMNCTLCHSRNQVVFGSGSEKPLFMIIGEAPGEEEDKTGIPFMGLAGQKLNKILEFVGVSRNEIYISNSVLCRPPNNRNPLDSELDACKQRLEMQIDLLQPKLIIVLGRIATKQLFGHFKGSLSQFFNREDLVYKTSKVIVTYHPSYHLRSPEKAYKISLPHWKKVKEWVENERNL